MTETNVDTVDQMTDQMITDMVTETSADMVTHMVDRMTDQTRDQMITEMNEEMATHAVTDVFPHMNNVDSQSSFQIFFYKFKMMLTRKDVPDEWKKSVSPGDLLARAPEGLYQLPDEQKEELKKEVLKRMGTDTLDEEGEKIYNDVLYAEWRGRTMAMNPVKSILDNIKPRSTRASSDTSSDDEHEVQHDSSSDTSPSILIITLIVIILILTVAFYLTHTSPSSPPLSQKNSIYSMSP